MSLFSEHESYKFELCVCVHFYIHLLPGQQNPSAIALFECMQEHLDCETGPFTWAVF